MRRHATLTLLLALAAFVTSGCITATTIVKLKPNGSGTLESSIVMNTAVFKEIGEMMGGANRGPEEKGGSGPMTLSVTLPEAQLLMFAAQHGELGAVLRREGATKTLPRDQLPRVTFEAIEKIIGDLDQRRDKRLSQP